MKKKIFGGLTVFVITAIAAINVNVSLNTQSDNVASITLAKSEALAVEWNDWTQWLSQGLTQDEREESQPCPIKSENSGSGSVSYGGGSVSGSGSSSQTNPESRKEYFCLYGSNNCTAHKCS